MSPEGETVTRYIICYRQYGRWTATCPWDSRRDAERHADRYLQDPNKDYIRDITFLEVELPK